MTFISLKNHSPQTPELSLHPPHAASLRAPPSPATPPHVAHKHNTGSSAPHPIRARKPRAKPGPAGPQGSVLTNKYAEGYPGRRYYGGCEHADGAERLALERVRALFGCAWANVQPHSGAQANQAPALRLRILHHVTHNINCVL